MMRLGLLCVDNRIVTRFSHGKAHGGAVGVGHCQFAAERFDGLPGNRRITRLGGQANFNRIGFVC